MTLKSATSSVLKVFLFIVILLTSGVLVISARSDTVTPVVNMGVVYDGSAILYDTNFNILKEEIISLTSGEFDVRFDEAKTMNGGWNRGTIKSSVSALLEDPEVDMVLCLGFMSSAEICSYNELSKPAIASSVFNALVSKSEKTGSQRQVKNLNYILSTGNFRESIQLFQEVVPFKHLTIVVDKNVIDALPGFESIYEGVGKELDTDVGFVAADKTSSSVLTTIPDDTDAVVVAPLLSFSVSEYHSLINGLIGKSLPGFTIMGETDVERGFLAGLSSGVESVKLLRRIAINVQRILLGEKPESLPVVFHEDEKLVINMETARKIGFSPDWNVMAKATLINEGLSGTDRALTLSSVVRGVIDSNHDIETERRTVAAGAQEVKRAVSYLLPQVDVETTGVVIDKNRAELSFGTESEKKWSGSVNATQVLFSEKAWGGWASVKHAQESRVEAYETIKLDLALEVAKAYLNVLRAKTLERIRKNNLKLTHANLERARMRQSVGTAGASEVYRWESEIANHKKEVIQAEVAVQQAKNALNRILGKPQSTSFKAGDVALSDPILLVSDNRFIESVNTPEKFRLFQDFLVREGLAASPELKQIHAAIQASERVAVSAQRAHWMPDIVMQGNVSDVFERAGFSQVADERDKTAWSVAVNASLPLFSGGAKTADYIQAREESEKYRSERKSVADRVEERIRYTIQQARASYAGIELSKDAAEAARKNLNLVTDAYSRGVLSIIDLLDAQNASMLADQGAENAVYDFLIDVMSVQRSIGCIDYSEKDLKDALYDRLVQYMKNPQTNG